MTPEEFVKGFYDEKEMFMDNLLNPNYKVHSNELFESLDLNDNKKQILKEAIDALLTDVFYTILLGLDGESQIGGWQHGFSILDDKSNELTGGEIEGFAYEYFRNSKKT